MLKSARFVIAICTLIFSLPLFADPKCNTPGECTFFTVHNNTGGPLTIGTMTPKLDDYFSPFGMWKEGNFNRLMIPANADTSDTLYIGESVTGMQFAFTALMIGVQRHEPCMVVAIVLRLFGVPMHSAVIGDGSCSVKERKEKDGLHVDITLNKE